MRIKVASSKNHTSYIIHHTSESNCREAAGRLLSKCSYKLRKSCPLNIIHHPSDFIHHIMFDKERFHNALALSLGYERIVKDKRITIVVDDSDDPWVTLKFQSCPVVVRFKASGEPDAALSAEVSDFQKEIQPIADAVHQAYIQATTNPF